ncbi:hypothetical protein [Limosilactobacillus vaginalis]|uniref:hypothetical protein n=1 Tax=Limosilactobacillus vaginalis TaxID=1633 RepID=UPI00288A8F63|nr:hypothetical protein [Limosilactobacillus vaginalis]
MDKVAWLTDMCVMLNEHYTVCNSMNTNYKKLINKNHIGGYRVGFHFYNGKTKTPSRSDFYQVFAELAEQLEKHPKINATLEVKINKDFAFVDVALTNQPQ